MERWARNHNKCMRCERSTYPHHAGGFCRPCYQSIRRWKIRTGNEGYLDELMDDAPVRETQRRDAIAKRKEMETVYGRTHRTKGARAVREGQDAVPPVAEPQSGVPTTLPVAEPVGGDPKDARVGTEDESEDGQVAALGEVDGELGSVEPTEGQP